VYHLAASRPEASEVVRLVADSSRLRALTGWRPFHSLHDGLRETIHRFSDPANLAHYRPGVFNL
jgi:NDP-hexose 4,6-dehydratase